MTCLAEGEPTSDNPNPAIFMKAALSPDGTLAVVACFDSTLKVWDLSNGLQLRTMWGHKTKVLAVRFMPGGRQALSTSADGTFKMWDVLSGKCLRTFDTREGVPAVCPSSDGRTALSGGSDGSLRLWELSTGCCLLTFSQPVDVGDSLVGAVDLTGDGQLALAAVGKRICIWEVPTGKLIRSLQGHQSMVFDARFSPGGRFILSGSRDQTLRLWEVATGHCQRILSGSTDDVRAVAFSSDARFAYSGSFGEVIQWFLDWDLEDRLPAGGCDDSPPQKLSPVARRGTVLTRLAGWLGRFWQGVPGVATAPPTDLAPKCSSTARSVPAFQVGRCVDDSANNPEVARIIDRAIAEFYRGNLRGAMTALSKALEIESNNHMAYETRGAIHEHLGKYDEALADYATALQLAPVDAARLYLNMANSFGRKGENDMALATYAKALRIQPSYPEAYCGRAVAWGLKGDYDAAIVECTEALRFDPKNLQAFELRSRAYHQVGDVARAKADAAQAARLKSPA
jgi:Flp pilus assembly protein TadD